MLVAITGASGFIGSVTAAALHRAGHARRALVRRTSRPHPIQPHLTAYHHTYGMNTSSWRPAAVYGVDPNLERSQWLDLIRTAKRGGTIDTPQGGKITHVQDIADALTLALGDEQTAGQLYNL